MTISKPALLLSVVGLLLLPVAARAADCAKADDDANTAGAAFENKHYAASRDGYALVASDYAQCAATTTGNERGRALVLEGGALVQQAMSSDAIGRWTQDDAGTIFARGAALLKQALDEGNLSATETANARKLAGEADEYLAQRAPTPAPTLTAAPAAAGNCDPDGAKSALDQGYAAENAHDDRLAYALFSVTASNLADCLTQYRKGDQDQRALASLVQTLQASTFVAQGVAAARAGRWALDDGQALAERGISAAVAVRKSGGLRAADDKSDDDVIAAGQHLLTHHQIAETQHHLAIPVAARADCSADGVTALRTGYANWNNGQTSTAVAYFALAAARFSDCTAYLHAHLGAKGADIGGVVALQGAALVAQGMAANELASIPKQNAGADIKEGISYLQEALAHENLTASARASTTSILAKARAYIHN